MDEAQIHTIGHSDTTIAEFLDLLLRHDITLIVDVRSQPYSRWAPQFNREVLFRYLKGAGIGYESMGDLLGGQPSDPALYDPGHERPDYHRMEKRPDYQIGIDRLLGLARSSRIAVLCSEGDHNHCHRHLLIAQTLLGRGARVLHIRPDGSTVAAEPVPQQLSLFG